jgi:predicted MPP superfamily phosphohydrolase
MFQGLFLLLIIGIDIYAFQSFRTICADYNQPIKGIIYSLYWLFSVGLPIVLVSGFYVYSKSGVMPDWGKFGGSLFISMIITQLFIVFVLFGEDIFRLGDSVYQKFLMSNDVERAISGRRKFISQASILIASVPFLSFIYGITKGKYNFKVHRTVLYFKDLPKAFEGFTIAQLSDIHSGSFTEQEGVIKGIELLNEQKPDLFVFTGDLVNSQASEFLPWVDIFKNIQAKFGKFSILGNHDYGDYHNWGSQDEKKANFQQLLDLQKQVEFQLLLDENVKIEKDGSFFTLIGVHNWGKRFGRKGDLDKALEGVSSDSIKVLLSHDPTHFDEKVANHDNHIHLTLSGHTHGAQMGVEFPFLKWSPVKYIYPKWAGLYQENGRFLYVNRGFGYLGFAGRVGIWPEISIFEMRSA